MSADRITEVSSMSWFGRIGNALKGMLFGFILFVVAFPLLFWNEGRAVKTYKSLTEGAGAVVSVSSEKVEPSNSGKLVHVTGNATTAATLADPVFTNLTAKALKLKRIVEMYQWKETVESKTEKNLGGSSQTTKTYTYTKEWSEHPVSSSSFNEPEAHRNPESMPYITLEQVASPVTLGGFTLSESLVSMIKNYSSYYPETMGKLPDSLKDKIKVYGSGYFIGADPASPQIGDLRIVFQVAHPTEVSVIAGQTGTTFAPYQTKAGDSIELLETGTHSSAEMFKHAQDSNRMLTWILRGAGFLAMFIGLVLIFNPLSVLADVIPILGTIIGAGTSFVALIIALMLSSGTIAIAWIFYRPLLGIGILAITTVMLFVLIITLMKGGKRTGKAN